MFGKHPMTSWIVSNVVLSFPSINTQLNTTKKWPISSRKFIITQMNTFIFTSPSSFSENEANKRKLQQMQIKLEETENKEQGTLAKLQECIQIVEQGQFEKNEVRIRIRSFLREFRRFFLGNRRAWSNSNWINRNSKTIEKISRWNER